MGNWLMSTRSQPWLALKYGFHRKCPHCGQGALLAGWLTVRSCCSACGFVYERNAGDTWAFWIVGDRIPVAAAIAAIYLGVAPQSSLLRIVFFAALALLLIGTIPHRVGVVIALDYLSRRYWPDPADVLPPQPSFRQPAAP